MRRSRLKRTGTPWFSILTLRVTRRYPRWKARDLVDADAFLITHGHFDHCVDLPQFCPSLNKKAYGPAEVTRNLQSKHGMSGDLLVETTLGEKIEIGPFSVTPLSAEHISFDLPIILSTAGNILSKGFMRRWPNLKRNLDDHRKFPMGRCVAWLVEHNGKRLLHLGSLALDENEAYPQGVDVLSLPLQGHSRVQEIAAEIAAKLKPKAVYAHHFDDAFPPISQAIPTEPFVKQVRQNSPGMQTLVPTYREPIEF